MRALCEKRAATLDPLHYGALTGTHSCIRDIFELASAYLTNLRLTQPAPEPPAAPTPPQPLRTLRDVVEALGDTLQPQPDDLPIGLDDELVDSEGLP
jgi:hypothetical protein